MEITESISASVHPLPTGVSQSPNVPPLENGDRLSREEFERRYSAMPHIKKAELIEGVVYMASPVRLTQHGEPHLRLAGWLVAYQAKTSGLIGGDNATSRLDEKNVTQPDLILLLPTSLGGKATIDEKGYVTGAPDLAIEIAASSVSIDLHDKLEAYQRNGVREYLVYRTQDQAVDWFELVNGKYVAMQPDASGRYCSKLFPGLWLDPAALVAGDLPKLLAAVEGGTKSAEHSAFVERLAAASG